MSDVAYSIETLELDNGLRVAVSPDPGLGVVAVNLWYDVGSRHERPTRQGFAHLFEHLMFQGSRNVASGQHMELLHSNGASLNATTSFDRTNYFESFPSGALDLALWLEADRLAYLSDALDQANLDNQRDVVYEERRQRMDNVPYGTSLERLVPLMFPADHPYGHLPIGNMQQLAESSLEEVRDFHSTFYLPSNAVLTIAGDVTADEGFAKAHHYFGPIASGPRPTRSLADPLGPVVDTGVDKISADVPVPAAYLGCRLPKDEPQARELAAAELVLGVLGFGETSRLHRRLVRRDQVASSVSAYVSRMISGNSFGMLTVRIDPRTDLDEVVDAVDEEVRALSVDGPTEDEVQIAIASSEREWFDDMATAAGRADAISQARLLFGDARLVNDYLPMLHSLTADELGKAAADWLTALTRAQVRYEPTGDPG